MQIDILRASGPYRARDRGVVRSVRGESLAEISLAPPLLVDMMLGELRATGKQPTAAVVTAIERAADSFASETLAGQTPAQYLAAVNHAVGLPLPVIEAAVTELRLAMKAIGSSIGAQVPTGIGARRETDDGLLAETRWIPRGLVLGVIPPSNHPGTHIAWLQALALGYKLAIKPSRREPFTAHRLALALLAAGLDPAMLAVFPGEHQAGAQLVARADCALVFGGEQALRGLSPRGVVVHRGPGYSKVVAGRDAGLDADAIAASVVRSAAGEAGVKCSNASGFLSDRPDFDQVQQAVAAKLAAATAGPIGDRAAELPVFSLDEAKRLAAVLDGLMARTGLEDLCAGKDRIIDFGDGSAAVQPAALAGAQLQPEILRMELPFPALWLGRVAAVDDVPDFGATLVMGYMGRSPRLRERLENDPRIGKVIRGPLPTHRFHPGLPHDGFLGQALMVAKASVESCKGEPS